MKYTALCLFCRDENSYLREWVGYHLLLGIEHIIIYDDCSRIPLSSTVEDYIANGTVTVIRDAGPHPGKQCRLYNHCLREFGHKFVWIGFIDTDEFIVLKSSQQIGDFLKPFEPFGGLGMFWYCFGSNGLIKRPANMLDHFIRRSADSFPDNKHIKSFVNTRFVLPITPLDPHHFLYRPGFNTVDEFENPIIGPIGAIRNSVNIQLNHYILRSRDEFQEKIKRMLDAPPKNQAFFDAFDAHCNAVLDTSIIQARKTLEEFHAVSTTPVFV